MPFVPFVAVPLEPAAPFADAAGVPSAPFVAIAAAPRPLAGWRSGNGAGRISRLRLGAHVRQRPSSSFQQFGHVYCRHCMQKLKVLWNASSCEDVTARSVSLRAAAIASSMDVLSSSTNVFRPRESTLTFRRRSLGTADSNV